MAKSPTVEVVMQQNRTLRTTKGHTIQFKRNEPRTIPRAVLDEAMRFGAVPTEMKDAPTEEEPEPKPQVSTVEERRDLIKEGIKVLRERKGRDDFNASGRAAVDKLKEVTGLSDIQADERNAAQDELKVEEAEEG